MTEDWFYCDMCNEFFRKTKMFVELEVKKINGAVIDPPYPHNLTFCNPCGKNVLDHIQNKSLYKKDFVK